jgi:hypothetical protein
VRGRTREGGGGSVLKGNPAPQPSSAPTCITKRCHSAATARAFPNTSACSASRHNRLLGGADRGSANAAAAAAAASLPPAGPAVVAEVVLLQAYCPAAAAAAEGPEPELELLRHPEGGADSLLLLRLRVPLPGRGPTPTPAVAAAAVTEAEAGRGGLSRSRRTLSKTLSGGRGGAVGSPCDSHQSAPDSAQNGKAQHSTAQRDTACHLRMSNCVPSKVDKSLAYLPTYLRSSCTH